MNAARNDLYERLESQIGNTPLAELPLDLPTGNVILVKEEFRNPTGSHYDRVYIHLLKQLEKEGKIVPGETPLIETTSGSAGESFAWLCHELGYHAAIVLPESAPPQKVRNMREHDAELIMTPANQYVNGVVNELRRQLTEVNKERKSKGLPKYYSPNHSRDNRTLDALEKIAIEALEQTDRQIDYFIAAIGNGSSLLGPARYVKQKSPDTKIVAWEPFESGLAMEMVSPGFYADLFGISIGLLRHRLYGTGETGVDFPFLEEAIQGEKVDKVTLVHDDNTENKLKSIIDPHNQIALGGAFGDCSGKIMRRVFKILNVRRYPNWERMAKRMAEAGYKAGRTTAGSVAVAEGLIDIASDIEIKLKRRFPFFRLVEKKPQPKTFLVVGYDLASKYN